MAFSLFFPLFFTIVASVIIVSVTINRLRMQRFSSDFVGDPGFTVKKRLRRHEVSTCDAALEARLWPTPQTSSRFARWRIEVPQLRLGAIAPVRLGTESLARALLEKLGVSDIQIGDAHFDGRFSIHGKNEVVIRAAFADPALRAALTRLFEDHRVPVFHVDNDGLVVEIDQSMASAREVLVLVREIAALLEKNTPTLPLLATLYGSEGLASDAASTASGAPVGVKSF